MMNKKDNPIPRDIFDHMGGSGCFFPRRNRKKSYLHEQMNNQLNSIRELQAIPIADDIPVTTHGVDYGQDGKPHLRKDDWVACENSGDILAQAPRVENDYIVVPDIPTTELE